MEEVPNDISRKSVQVEDTQWDTESIRKAAVEELEDKVWLCRVQGLESDKEEVATNIHRRYGLEVGVPVSVV